MDETVKSFFQIQSKYHNYLKKQRRKFEDSENQKTQDVWSIFLTNPVGGSTIEESKKPKPSREYQSFNQYLDQYNQDLVASFLNHRIISTATGTFNLDEQFDYERLIRLKDDIHQKVSIVVTEMELQKERKREVKLQKKEEEQRTIESYIPRFNTGCQLFANEWNEFFYPPYEENILQLMFLEVDSISELFVKIFIVLFDELKDVKSLEIFADMTYHTPIKFLTDLNRLPKYRRFSFFLGYIFSEPFLEKELNEHIAFFALNLWWYLYVPIDKISDENFLTTNRNEVYFQMRSHFDEKLLPLLKKIVMKSLIESKMPMIQDSEIVFFRERGFEFTNIRGTFVNFKTVIVLRDCHAIDEFHLIMAQYQNDLKIYFEEYSRLKRQLMIQSQKIDQVRSISSLSCGSLQKSPLIEITPDPIIKKTFNEILNTWFVDTHVSEEPVLSRSTEILIRRNNQNIGGCVVHVDRNYENYRSYHILQNYFSNPELLGKLIFSDDISKPPNINLDHYFYLFLSNITVNCFSFDNISNHEEKKIAETIIMQIIYLLETRFEVDNFNWWIFENDMYPENPRDFEIFLKNFSLNFHSNTPAILPKTIFEIIFFDVCKKCFFKTAEFLILFFLKSQCDPEDHQLYERLIDEDDVLFVPKYRQSCYFDPSKGQQCFMEIFKYLVGLVETDSPVYALIIMRNIQNMFLNHHSIVSGRKNKKQKSLQDMQDEMKKDHEQKMRLALKNEEFWKRNATRAQPHNIIQTILSLKEYDIKNKLAQPMEPDVKAQMHVMIVYLLNAFWNYAKSKSSMKIMDTVVEYVSNTLTVLVEKINFVKTDENSFFTKIISYSLQNDRFKTFIGQITNYFDRTIERKIDNLNVELAIKMNNLFETRAKNQNITMLHEIILYLVIWYLYLNHSLTMMGQDKLYGVTLEIVIAKRKFMISRNMKESQAIVRHSMVGDLSCHGKGDFFKIINIFSLFQFHELRVAFDEISVFIQYTLLFSHNFNWTNIRDSLNIHFLNFVHQRETFSVDSKSYYDLNEESSSHLILCDQQINISRIDELINIIFCFERFFIEKNKSCAKVHLSLDELYRAAEKSRVYLERANYQEMTPIVSHTPESKKIQLLISFLKMKIVSLFQLAQTSSSYPEDAFMMLLIQEKRKTIQLLMSVMNVILSIYVRVKIAASVSDQFVSQHESIPKNFVLNPLRYAITDALSDHAFWVRMMQKTITSNSDLLSYAWLALPDKVGRKYLTNDLSNLSMEARIRTLSIDLKLFSKKTNPTNYLDWRMWFATLPHLITQNYNPASLSKPILGKVYCLMDLYISKPLDPFQSQAASSSS